MKTFPLPSRGRTILENRGYTVELVASGVGKPTTGKITIPFSLPPGATWSTLATAVSRALKTAWTHAQG